MAPHGGRKPDRIAVVRDWVQRELVDSGRLPLFLCFAAFLVTFVTTRVVTRMIRADRGPFKDNVSASGLHVHHAVPGIVLLVVGAVTAIATDTDTRWSALAAVLVGVGTSLVLDEFALILHLEDVYWAEEGRISVEMVSLAVASMGLVLVGFTPFDLSQEDSAALSVTLGGFALHLVWIVVCVSKGKYKMAFFGVFFTIVALVGALRWPGPVRAGRAVATARTSSLEPRHVPPGSTPASGRHWTGSATSSPASRPRRTRRRNAHWMGGRASAGSDNVRPVRDAGSSHAMPNRVGGPVNLGAVSLIGRPGRGESQIRDCARPEAQLKRCAPRSTQHRCRRGTARRLILPPQRTREHVDRPG